MKILTQTFFSILLLCLLIACGNSNSNSATAAQQDDDKTLLAEAAKIHQEAMDIALAIAPRLAALRQVKNGINVQGRALTDDEMDLVKYIEQIEASHKYWQENLVEVPGHDHHHHGAEGHNHSHDHSHSSGPQLSATQMLTAQKEIRDSIVSIQGRIEELDEMD